MATNLQLLRMILKSGSPAELERAAINMAERLDIIANMKADSRVGELQLITGAQFFNAKEEPVIPAELGQPVQLTAYMIEAAVKKLMECEHPHVSTQGGDSDVLWCNVCGAIQSQAGWVSPHCRDLLIMLVGQ